MLKILIADDHAIVREGLKQILAETADMVVAGEATNGQEVLELVRKKILTWFSWTWPCLRKTGWTPSRN